MTLFAVIFHTADTLAQMPAWLSNVKLSGYGITQYQYSSQENAKSNSFNLRLARISLDGRIVNDFYWKAQIQFNGNTSTLGSSPRLVDLFAEWQKYDFFRVKLGQYKNPFTFENPMHPIDQGFMSCGQAVLKLAGFSDRAGAHSSNGRDIGLQFQGDFLKNNKGRNLIHYQVGVFNGQGINVKDVDQQKILLAVYGLCPFRGCESVHSAGPVRMHEKGVGRKKHAEWRGRNKKWNTQTPAAPLCLLGRISHRRLDFPLRVCTFHGIGICQKFEQHQRCLCKQL